MQETNIITAEYIQTVPDIELLSISYKLQREADCIDRLRQLVNAEFIRRVSDYDSKKLNS